MMDISLMDISFQIDWDARHSCWVAWAHQQGHVQVRGYSPQEALAKLLYVLNAESYK